MSQTNPLEAIVAIYRFFELLIKFMIFLFGCLFQPYYFWLHHQNELARIVDSLPLANRLGLKLSRKMHPRMSKKWRFLRKVKGRGHYAINVMTGKYKGHNVTLFDYHSRSINGAAKVWQYSCWFRHDYVSFFLLDLEREFPALTIEGEDNGIGLFARIADAVGAGDFDFESHEFSEKFDVRGESKKFAYDFCNAQMMEYLLGQPIRPVEIEQNILAMQFDSELKGFEIDDKLGRLLAVRQRMPEYLFAD